MAITIHTNLAESTSASVAILMWYPAGILVRHCSDLCQRHYIMMDSDLKWNHMTLTYNGIMWLTRTGWTWILSVTRWCQLSLSHTAKWIYKTITYRRRLWNTIETIACAIMKRKLAICSRLDIWCGKLVPSKNIFFSKSCSLVCVVLLCINSPHT